MNSNDDASKTHETEEESVALARWCALDFIQRRIAGVLVEKSKTTPDVYPMTLNGIKTASNQKSNRSPQLDLREDQVEQALYDLRQLGAVVEVHSGGRVPKFKHQLYEWMGVTTAELAVMAELLLRGEQTLGELRGRASRMTKISDLGELRPVIASLIQQGLVIPLTPSGRGQIVTHGLYEADELEGLKSRFSSVDSGDLEMPPRTSRRQEPMAEAARGDWAGIQQEIAQLRLDVDQLKKTVADLQR
ncbi:YceH family protein [bacterium]|jgi:uncharacterized protein YceH (UPF0502 family)|nr:YceH family protein [Mariniblastus sp.]MDB4357125.1 YceH family protein [Mariniblastus sp.]MDB4386430.1 YceH family protein [bacterium]